MTLKQFLLSTDWIPVWVQIAAPIAAFVITWIAIWFYCNPDRVKRK